MLTVGSLFAGIGGFDLGFERAGMRTLWQVEQSEFCRRVLAKHFPEAHRFNDVRDVTGDPRRWAEEGGTLLEYVDVLCGGFPCQDISVVGRGAGIEGERSGLWSEYARLIRELRPRYVVVENVAALLGRGLGTVLGDLAALGYDAEWDCIPASAVGAPHRRDRLWLVAYASSSRRREDARSAHGDEAAHEGWPAEHDHVADGDGQGGGARAMAHTELAGLEGHGQRPLRTGPVARSREGSGDIQDALGERRNRRRGQRPVEGEAGANHTPAGPSPWSAEPDVGRVAHGVPARMDRLHALGNALVPQIAELIGRRIIEAEGGIAA